MRRLAAMKYRIAGATYRVIAEKLDGRAGAGVRGREGHQHRAGDDADQSRLDQDCMG